MADKPITWHVLTEDGGRATVTAVSGDEAWYKARKEFGKALVSVATFPPEA